MCIGGKPPNMQRAGCLTSGGDSTCQHNRTARPASRAHMQRTILAQSTANGNGAASAVPPPAWPGRAVAPESASRTRPKVIELTGTQSAVNVAGTFVRGRTASQCVVCQI